MYGVWTGGSYKDEGTLGVTLIESKVVQREDQLYLIPFLKMISTGTALELTTNQQSLQILKNTVSLGVSSILYLRNVFGEETFDKVSFESLNLVQLKPRDRDSCFIVNLLKCGVNDALQRVSSHTLNALPVRYLHPLF